MATKIIEETYYKTIKQKTIHTAGRNILKTYFNKNQDFPDESSHCGYTD